MSNKSYSLEEWIKGVDKDDPSPFSSEEFRNDYEKNFLESKAEKCRSLIWYQVFDLVDELERCQHRCLTTRNENSGLQRPAGITLKILSLGCGPGTDLLAAIWACIGTRRVTEIQCFGVDINPWSHVKLCELVAKATADRNIAVQLYFQTGDYGSYVEMCIRDGLKFDLVISCYASAYNRCPVLGQRVPKILSARGRIFVIENNLKKLHTGLAPYTGFSTAGYRHNGKLIFLMYKQPWETCFY